MLHLSQHAAAYYAYGGFEKNTTDYPGNHSFNIDVSEKTISFKHFIWSVYLTK